MKHRNTPPVLPLLVIILSVASVCRDVSAQSAFTWDGGGADGNWTTAANWNPDGAPGSPQAFLNFAGSTRLNNTNNFSAGSAGYQIYFKSGAGGFTLNGNSILLFDFGGGDPNIQNEGATSQTVSFPISIGNTHGVNGILNINANTSPAQGPLVFNGTITANDANIATRAINISGPGAVALNGVISDFSSSGKIGLTQLGSGTTTLGATNTCSGDTSINAGTVRISANNGLTNSTIRLGDTSGSTGANLNLDAGKTFNSLINVRSGSSGAKIIANTSTTSGQATYSGTLFLDDNATLFANANGSNLLSGTTLDLKNQTLTLDGTGNNIISGSLTNSTGSGKLVKNNTGTLVLNSANSFTGGTTLSGGIINLNNSSGLGTGSLTYNSSAVRTVIAAGLVVTNPVNIGANAGVSGLGLVTGPSSGSGTLSGPINISATAAAGGHFDGGNATAGLILSGPLTSSVPISHRLNRMTLSGGGSYSLFQCNGGTTVLGANNGLATNTVLEIATGTVNGTVDMAGFNQTINGLQKGSSTAILTNSSSSSDSTLTISGATSNTTYGGVLSDRGVSPGKLNFTVAGGIFTMSSTNTYAGDTTISGGTNKIGASYVVIPNGAGKGNVVVGSAGTLDLNTFSIAVNGLSGNGTVDTVAGGTPTFTVGNSTVSSNFSGVIKNTAGTLSLTKAGAGTQTLSGNNSFSGGVTVSAGVLRLAHNNAAGTSAKTVTSVARTGGLELDGGVTIPAAINFTLSNDGNASTVPYALRSVTGVNTIGGIIKMTSGGGFAIVTVDSGSTLVLNGAITNDQSRNLIVQGAGSGIINGNLANGVGTTSLQVNGGTWTLNAANSYSGVTTNTGSTLILGPNGSISNSPIVIAGVGGLLDVSGVSGGFTLNGAIAQMLGGSGVVTGNVAAATGARISPGASAGTLTLTNSLTETGGVTNIFELSNVTTEGSGVNDELIVGNLNLSGTNTILINPIGGTLANGTYKIIRYTGTLNGGATNFVTAFTTTPPRTTVTVVDTTPGELDLVISATPASLVWQGDGANNTWNTVSSNWLNGASLDLFYSSDSVTFDDSTANLTVSLTNAVNPASVLVNAAGNYTFTNNGKISGSTGLTKTNSGTLTITTTNDFVGKTVIGGGTIAMAAETALGANPSSFASDQLQLNGGAVRATASFTIDDINRGVTLGAGGGTLNTDTNMTLTVANAIAGAGTLTKAGPGTLTLNVANTFTNTTTINQGTVFIGNNSALGTADGGTTVGAGTQVRTTSALTLAEPFTLNSAGGAISVGGNRNLTLNGPITLASGTTIHADGGSSFTINGNVTGTDTSFTNDLNGAATTTINGALSLGAGAFVQQGATVVLTNTGNNWSGGTLSTGTLQVGNGGQSGSLGLGAITDNGALNFNTAASLTVNDPISGSGTLSQNGAGTITLNGSVSVNGAIAANSGTLVLAGNNSFTNTLTIIRPGAPVVRLAHNNGLGATSGATFIQGNNNGSGRLELSNNITAPELLTIECRQAPVADAAAILNVSGNNTLSGLITVAVGGSELNVQSDAGTLTVSANLSNSLAGVRNLKLMGAASGEWSGVITNITEVIKTNIGTWTLSGANSYTGATTVAQGTLKVNNSSGSGTGSGVVTVAAGATLAGSGTISGTVALSGAVKPGNSVGLLSTGPETWNGGASYVAEVIDATNAPGVGYDSLNITGGINLQAVNTNQFTINLISLDGTGSPGAVTNFDNSTGYSWTIASTTGGSVTNFDSTAFAVNTSSFSNDLAGGAFLLQSGSLNVVFTNNHAPAAATVALERPRGTPTKIKLVDLATNWSDADNDAMTFVSVSASSTNGVSNVSTNDTYLFYNPGTNGDVTDLVSYVIRDIRSGYTTRPNDTVRSTTGLILITIAPEPTNQTFNITGIAPLPDGNQRISFAGIPGSNYLVQAATNLSPPIPWLTLSTNTAGTNGLWYYDDLDATNYTSRFYRSAQP